ncbi:MAG: 4Fe-4S cluster-binding domain-containing protein [Candidatus Bathyarchaeia archaeon]
MQTTLDDRVKSNVFLTLQRNPWEKGGYTRTFAIQKCGGEPYEIALRFAGCCMKCGPCFASGYSWVDRFDNNHRVTCMKTFDDVVQDYQNIKYPVNCPSYNWLRILGGEPLLNNDYIRFLFDTIIKISEIDSQKFNNGVIIQTNGIFIGQGNISLLQTKLEELYRSNPKVKVCIEISIKGTNAEEFELITRSANRSPSELSKFEKLFGWKLSKYSPDELFVFNIKAYYKLRELVPNFPNFRPTIIAGFGVNESYLLQEGNSNERITIIFKNKKPIYHPEFWSEDFKELYEDFTSEASITFDSRFRKMPMYGIKDLFEYAWVGPAIKQGKRIYGYRWYDRKYIDEREEANIVPEEAFSDILNKFFFIDNRTYYSTLINWKT